MKASPHRLAGLGSRTYFAIAMSVLVFFGISTPVSQASAETITIYVEKMPQHWQDQFGNVLSEATQYWEDKTPDLKFDTTQYVDKSDFVVEWASQYGEGNLGYYSTDTENAYGKPTMAITLGFFKDGQWQLASSEQVLQITKHEIGHAIGLPYSADPDDIMYPTVEDRESWQDQEQGQISNNASADWQGRSEKYQALANEKILPLAAKIDESRSLLDSASYDSKAANKELDNAWTAFWWAKKHLSSAEKMQSDGGSAVLQSNYHDAYIKFKSSYDYAKKAEQKLAQISDHCEKASSLDYN